LVEDEPALRLLLEMLLKQAGYSVLTAGSGAAALKMWPEHRESINLMLTDMVMPEGLSGKQLAEKLKAEKPALRVIFMSGYNTEIRGGVSGIEEGFNFLQKPFAHPALLQTVRRKLDGRR
jgi:DNA-binding NtrC family response regulator